MRKKSNSEHHKPIQNIPIHLQKQAIVNEFHKKKLDEPLIIT